MLLLMATGSSRPNVVTGIGMIIGNSLEERLNRGKLLKLPCIARSKRNLIRRSPSGEKLTTIEYEYPELMGIKDSDIDAVLLTHLDCDHANCLPQVNGAKKYLVSADELKFASKPTNRVRYYKGWWKDIPLTTFNWNDTQGPVGKSYDLLGDGSIELIDIPGHADGLFAVKVKNEEGKFVLLFSDGGYARKSLEEQITSGIAADKRLQKQSLAWIREQSLNPNCVESLANHDPDIAPHVIEL